MTLSTPVRRSAVRLGLAILGGVALLGTACGGDADEFAATAGGFVIEPAGEIGPDAFTAPVDTAPEGACDKAALIAQLQGRPEALGQWAAVLGLPASEVATYIQKLVPRILDQDTDVTNHGLHDGQAYARPSRPSRPAPQSWWTRTSWGLRSKSGYPTPPRTSRPRRRCPPPVDAHHSMPTTTGPPTSGAPQEQPVTRCKCGNPLLPPFSSFVPVTTDTTTTTFPGDDDTDTTDYSSTTHKPSTSGSSSTSSSTSSTSSTTTTTDQGTPSPPDSPDEDTPPQDDSQPSSPDEDTPQNVTPNDST